MLKENKNKALVFLDNLCALSLFPLLEVCLKLRPATVFYFRASKIGLKIADWLKTFRIISKDPIRVDDVYLCDTKDSVFLINKFESLNLCLKSQERINNLVDKCLPEFDSYFRQVCSVGVRKEWQVWLDALLFQLSLARVLARKEEIPTHKVVLISQFAPLQDILKVGSKISNNIKICPQPFKMKAYLYLWGPIIFTLGNMMLSLVRALILSKKEKPTEEKKKPVVGVAAAWGFKGLSKNKLDDFFWWRQTTLSPKRLIYIFERVDFQPTRERLIGLEKLGIKSIALNQKYPGDAAEVGVGRQLLSLAGSFKRFFFYSKLAWRGLLGDGFVRSVCSLIGWQIHKSEKLVPVYKAVNLRGIFHFHESGLEFVNLAVLQNNAARIGAHWSCLTAPNESAPRCHEVYFVWGAHDLKIILDSGSISKNILISGCFLNEHSHKEEHEKGRKIVQSMKKLGVRYTLTLFDNSLPVPNFYRFFLQWLAEDPDLGILIKSKGDSWKSVHEDGMGGLVRKAMSSGRIFEMDHRASPADAALLSDFAVGVTGISAISVAGLQGARVLYLDYERLDHGSLKPYGVFHSLGPKRCVFYDPESLKEAVLEYVNNPEANPCLGDVSPVLDQLDPFRDGKASQRIGEYVTWYLKGLDENFSKDEALRAATGKYAKKWGVDKVIRSS